MKRIYLKTSSGNSIAVDEKFRIVTSRGNRIYKLSSDKGGSLLVKNLADLHLSQKPVFRYGANISADPQAMSDESLHLGSKNYSVAGEKSAAGAQQDSRNLLKSIDRDVSEAESSFYKQFYFEK